MNDRTAASLENRDPPAQEWGKAGMAVSLYDGWKKEDKVMGHLLPAIDEPLAIASLFYYLLA
jgi:hypothetical protein